MWKPENHYGMRIMENADVEGTQYVCVHEQAK